MHYLVSTLIAPLFIFPFEDMPANFFKSVKQFVESSGGSHPIRKILIANNGIGATKAIRSIRRWSFETFGDERMVI